MERFRRPLTTLYRIPKIAELNFKLNTNYQIEAYKINLHNVVIARQYSQKSPSASGLSEAKIYGSKEGQQQQASSVEDVLEREIQNEPARSSSLPSGRSQRSPNVEAEIAVHSLEQLFSRFEEKCHLQERVNERDFVKTFDTLTRTVEKLEALNQMTKDNKINLSLLAAVLIRCCGKPMNETPENLREMLAGNLWQFIKEKNIPVDISHYNSLIRVLNENQTNFDPQKMLDEITNAQLTPDRITYQRLIHQYCLQGNIDGATKLLEKMKDLDMELNELTFASLLLGYSKQENPPSTNEMFELMRTNGVEPSSKSYATAITAQAGALSKNPAAEDEIKKLQELIEKEEIQFSIYETVDMLDTLLPLKNNETVRSFIEFVLKQPTPNLNARMRVISSLFKAGAFEEASKIFWSHRPSTRALESGNSGIYYIKLIAQHKNVPTDFAMSECSKVKELQYNKKAFHSLYYNAALAGNLNLVRSSLQKIGDEDRLKVHYYWPLLAQAKDEDELVEVLKNDLNPKMNSNDLLDTFSQWIWPKFSNFSRLFELNKELGYDSNILTTSFLEYSVQANRIMEAVDFISKAPQTLLSSSSSESSSNEDLDQQEGRPATMQRLAVNDKSSLVGRLLNQIAEETKDPALVEKVFKLCSSPGQTVTARTASPLVKVHLLNGDPAKALETFFKLVDEHRVTPCKRDLMHHCLEKKDSDNLQKIMNISSELYGEANSLFDLAVCCLQTNKLKQAQKIFASPGFRVSPARIYETATGMAQAGRIAVLENFVHLSRDIYDVNTEYLYQLLIDAYERTSNGRRALDLWNRMQEEEFQPSKKSLLMIAKVLEKNNIEVPFQKPKK